MALLVTPPEQDPSLSPLGKVAMRPAVAADSAFLLELYASAWQDDLDTIGWSISSQRTFVIMQAQTREWELIRRYPQLNRLTICVDDTPAGRMLVSCTDTVVHLIDLCLLPLWRGRGIGTRLVKDLLDESASRADRYPGQGPQGVSGGDIMHCPWLLGPQGLRPRLGAHLDPARGRAVGVLPRWSARRSCAAQREGVRVRVRDLT